MSYTGERIRQISAEAQEAFWAKVVELTPDSRFGDFDPMAAFNFERVCNSAVRLWIAWNVPGQREANQ